ncbi:MAG: hypothetical protein Q9181_007767 [Wetmoreana brouardii]
MPPIPSLPPLPTNFRTLKSHILTSLSTPSGTYTDASPKGSVDTAIVSLIERINALDGVVTTSSCSGRCSVFLEGWKKASSSPATDDGEQQTDRSDRDGEEDGSGGVRRQDGEERLGAGEGELLLLDGNRRGKKKQHQKAVAGGKGMGGRWLFVSHNPILIPDQGGEKDPEASLMGMFGLSSREERRGDGGDRQREEGGRGRGDKGVLGRRFVRFAFEPMILHIATASLHHASPILKAAIAAGFRESGVQSLKNLYDPHALPMVAVRSAGLAFESVIGCVDEQWKEGEVEEEVIEALVDESYLEMLVGIANERFRANTERMKRFEEMLFAEEGKDRWWEDKEKRKERKRREGLRRKEEEVVKGDRRVVDDGNGKGDEDGVTGIGDLEGLR